MIHRLICAVIAVGLTVLAAPVAAQSLGDLARQEEVRRKTATSVKTFTNADLAPSEIAPPSSSTTASSADCYVSVKEGKCVEPDQVVANSAGELKLADPQVKTSEAAVRQQADSIRKRLEKIQKEIDVFAATADDAERSPGERAAAQRMVAQRDAMLASIEQQWIALEKHVDEQGVSREWLGVRPIFPTRIQQ